METIEALVLDSEDFSTPEAETRAVTAMAYADLVMYRGEIVKNRNGKITRRFLEVRAAEKRRERRVY